MEEPSLLQAVVENAANVVKGTGEFITNLTTPAKINLVVVEPGYTSGASSISSGGSSVASGFFTPGIGGGEELASSALGVARRLEYPYEQEDYDVERGLKGVDNPLKDPTSIDSFTNLNNPTKEEQLAQKLSDEKLLNEPLIDVQVNSKIPYIRYSQKLKKPILVENVQDITNAILESLKRPQIKSIYERQPLNPKGMNLFDEAKYNVTIYITFKFVEYELDNGRIIYKNEEPIVKNSYVRTLKAFPMPLIRWKEPAEETPIIPSPKGISRLEQNPWRQPRKIDYNGLQRADGESLGDWFGRMEKDLMERVSAFCQKLDEDYEYEIHAVMGSFETSFTWTGSNLPQLLENLIDRAYEKNYEDEQREQELRRQQELQRQERQRQEYEAPQQRMEDDQPFERLRDEENRNDLGPSPNVINIHLGTYDRAREAYVKRFSQVGRRPSENQKRELFDLKQTVIDAQNSLKSYLIENGVPGFNFTQRWNTGNILENTVPKLVEHLTRYQPLRLFGNLLGCSEGSKETITRGSYVLWSTSTKKKRCAIYCVMKKLGLGAPIIDDKGSKRAKSTKEDIIQQFLTFQFTTDGTQIQFPIPISQFPRLASYFNCNIELFVWNPITSTMVPLLDHEGNATNFYTDSESVTVKMMIENSHAYLIVKDGLENISKKVCPHCRKVYVNEHNVCDQTKIAYLNRRLEKNKTEISANEKFVTSINNRQCIFFDCETFTDERGEHIPYAIGWGIPDINSRGIKRKNEDGIVPIKWEFQYEWGEGCIQRFMDWLQKYINKGNESAKKQPKKILIGFNNANYDNLLLAKTCINNGMHFEFQIQNNALIGMQTDMFKTWDLCRFLPGQSLDSACKSFGASDADAKTCFPHKFITGWDKLDYIGVEPGPEYHWKVPQNWEYVTTPTWNLKEVCLKYLEKDIRSTIFVFNKLQETCFNALHVDIKEFITASHMSYDVWTNLISNAVKETKRINPFQDRKQVFPLYYPTVQQEDIFRQAIYGGRSYNTARSYESSFYQRIIDGETVSYDDIDDWMDVFDVVSLYASAMLFNEYPCGMAQNSTDEDLSLVSSLVEGHEYDDIPLGIFKVKYITNKKLVIPALPRKTFRRKSNGFIESQGLIWDLQDSEGYYTTVDIVEARKQGYEFEFVSGIQWPQKGPIFEKYIQLALELKCKGEEEGNETLRSLGKLLCNALYGKMLQRPIIENSALVKDSADLDKFLQTNNLTDIIFLNDKDKRLLVIGDECQKELKIRKPSYIGAFVLSYSRKIMHKFAGMADPWRGTNEIQKSMENSFLYTDTDSLFYRSTPHILEALKTVLKENQPGNLWYDLKGKPAPKVLKAVFLGPKTYLLIYYTKDGKLQSKMRSKGIPSYLLSQDDYTNLLETSQVDKKEVNQIRKVMHSKKEQIPFTLIATNVEKCLMKALWKGRVFISNEKSYPFGHEQIPYVQNIDEEQMISQESF